MSLRDLDKPSRWIRATVAVTAAFGLAVAGPVGSAAAGGDTRSAEPSAAVIAAGEAAVREALQRDLGPTAEELTDLLAALSGVEDRALEARTLLGDAYGGSWFDHDRRELVVGVTETRLADLVHATGARTRPVERSFRELAAITEGLDTLQRTDPATMADAYAWSINVHTNQVQLAVAVGRAEEFAGLLASHGDAVSIEEWSHSPVTTNVFWLDAGLAYNGCSTGFNVASPTQIFYLSAGHCGATGTTAWRNGFYIGRYVASYFPGEDDALVWVENKGPMCTPIRGWWSSTACPTLRWARRSAHRVVPPD
jgi:streptogrisin C